MGCARSLRWERDKALPVAAVPRSGSHRSPCGTFECLFFLELRHGRKFSARIIKKCLVVQRCMMGTSLPKEERLEDKIFPKESVRPNQTSSVLTCPGQTGPEY